MSQHYAQACPILAFTRTHMHMAQYLDAASRSHVPASAHACTYPHMDAYAPCTHICLVPSRCERVDTSAHAPACSCTCTHSLMHPHQWTSRSDDSQDSDVDEQCHAAGQGDERTSGKMCKACTMEPRTSPQPARTCQSMSMQVQSHAGPYTCRYGHTRTCRSMVLGEYEATVHVCARKPVCDA